SVNTQPLDLTIINKNDRLHFHLSGTNFFEEIKDKQFNQLQPVWNQALISENEKVYRGEYLAYQLFKKYSNGTPTPDEDQIPEAIHKFARSRYQEGYTKGIHDEDAALILKELLQLHEHIDLLHFAPKVRAAAQLFWERFLNEEQKALFDQQLQSAGVILEVFPETQELEYLIQQLESTIASWLTKTKLFHDSFSPLGGQGEKKTHFATKIAQYLFAERSANTQFVLSKEAAELHDEFLKHLKKKRAKSKYEQSVKNLQQRPSDQFRLIQKWVQAFVEQCKVDHYLEFTEETSVTLLLGNLKDKRIIQSETRQKLAELHGEHSSFNGHYTLDYNAFMQRLEAYESEVVPQFQQYHDLKHQKTEAFRQQLRLEEFKPRVLSSFVRNQLIDQVYLPIFGDNLAKQIGAVGENTRTDRMGMLLLISPPGYGKTTLMEYIASQLGLIFMKINGPAIGHQVTSLDPADAKNAATKKELEKLNLALEMGDNIMLYLDDIQHCNPEFLQKFISLTDGQRKIEGVYKGVTKTYDLRGKKVCVVMAGNPYTESGEKFRIPDMLANRSDIYNLGDIIGDTRAVFEMSYIENSLTSNPVLQKLANKSLKDVHQLVQLVYTGSREGMNLEGNHTPEEINEYVQILQKMLTVRDVVLKVNLEYIRSAAQADQYRTEPPFLLQGSYRNMNKLAEKIVPIMNEQELQTLLLSHYEGEAQTLTTGTEANLLKFKELIGKLSEEEAARWKAIKATYVQSKKRSGSQSMAQILRELRAFTEGLEGIRKVLEGK
ncbi:MAG: AAA family ATPase, partial [Bacteroidota bacterium]